MSKNRLHIRNKCVLQRSHIFWLIRFENKSVCVWSHLSAPHLHNMFFLFFFVFFFLFRSRSSLVARPRLWNQSSCQIVSLCASNELLETLILWLHYRITVAVGLQPRASRTHNHQRGWKSSIHCRDLTSIHVGGTETEWGRGLASSEQHPNLSPQWLTVGFFTIYLSHGGGCQVLKQTSTNSLFNLQEMVLFAVILFWQNLWRETVSTVLFSHCDSLRLVHSLRLVPLSCSCWLSSQIISYCQCVPSTTKEWFSFLYPFSESFFYLLL